MATLTEAQLQHMRSLGMNYAEIGKTVGLSREMVRRYADRYQVGNQCVQCKAPVPPRNRYCPKCREQHKREQAKSYHRPCFKTYDNRSIVREAYDYFQGRGCDVVMDAESGRNGPELWVDGSGVKCNRIVPVSRGFQVRLLPNAKAHFWYLSDGKTRFLIPMSAVTENKTYLAGSSPLQEYRIGDADAG